MSSSDKNSNKNASTIIFEMYDEVNLAKNLAKKKHAPLGKLLINNFPDGELYLRFLSDVEQKHVVLVCSLYNPNEKIIALCLAGKNAKDLGAKSVTAVIPYLAYMRQDIRFHSGEAISSKIMGSVIGKCVDKVITIDPHLHRLKSLTPVYHCRTKVLTAVSLMINFLKKKFHHENYTLVGPDWESQQWVNKIASGVTRKSVILHKTRFSSYKVVIDTAPLQKFAQNSLVIVDDVASTAKTLITVVKAAKQYGVKKIYVLVVHPLFVGTSYANLKKAGATAVYSCNTIPHSTNAMDVSELIHTSI